MSREFTIEGARVLITGASAGLGAEFARQFHAMGADLTLVARRADLLNRLAGELNAKRPGSAACMPLDLSSRAEHGGIDDLVNHIAKFPVHILVNNAGFGSYGSFERSSIEREVQMVEVNITATLRLVHAVLPQMRERGWGAIVSLSSIAAFQPLPYMSTYAATKAFNYFHSRAIAAELTGTGIRVLTVCPGPTRTEFGAVSRMPGEMIELNGDDPVDVVRTAIRALVRGRACVVTGWRSKLLSLVSRLTPRALSIPFVERVLRPRLPRAEAIRK